MSGNYRNTWKLPNNCHNDKCKKCVESWKRKAQKHAATAANLKFVLMCILDENSETHIADEEHENPCDLLTQTSEENGEMKASCGICKDKYTFGGSRNMVAFQCSHTVCLECAKRLPEPKCPYCRQTITKAIKLHYDKDPYDSD